MSLHLEYHMKHIYDDLDIIVCADCNAIIDNNKCKNDDNAKNALDSRVQNIEIIEVINSTATTNKCDIKILLF